VRAAVERGAWEEALDLLGDAGAAAASAEGLELRANAEYGNGGFEASIGAWEDLHTLLIREGDAVGAARAAGMLAMFLMMDTGLMATVRAWVRRAEKLLVGHDEGPAHAVLAVVHAYERFMCGDMDAARLWSATAIELGTRMSVDPVVVVGRVCAARVRIFDGDVQEGIDQLDELAIDLMSGMVDPLTTGIMYCELICAAQGMALHDRASAWTDTMNRWRDGAAIGAVSGRCRVHRAEILRVTGPCEAAEAEALGACDELRPWMRREFGWPLVELGNIRLRRGDLVGAEEAFLAAHDRAWSPHPGLALLRLEQGDAEVAATMIADAIAHPYEIPSKMRPPFGDLRLAPLLDAQVVIAEAIGDAATARRAADALVAIAASYPSASLAASATLAAARASLVEGDLAGSIHAAKASTAAWTEIGAPFEAATARLVLGAARDRSGDPAGASMEWRAAAAAFELFGASRWAEHARALVEPMPQHDPAAAAPAERSDQATNTANFRCAGDTRTIEFGGTTVMMRDLKGLRYVARLLADPGREFHVLDLVAIESGAWSRSESVGEDAATRSFSLAGSGLPAIDDAARAAYRRRLAEVNDDIDDAHRMNDLGRIELAERDRDYLIAELASAIGLGGVVRSTGGSAERARTSVTRSLRYSIDRLAEHHPALGAHLGQSINTGMYCSYTPDPLAPVAWRL
jgi:hypothetical protein